MKSAWSKNKRILQQIEVTFWNSWISSTNYCTKDSQNDLLDSAASVIKKTIIGEVQQSGMYAVIVDEARDISKSEQMSVCLRYVDGHEIKGRFLTFVTLRNDLSAEALATAIANALQSSGLNLKLCASQCYDGASVMSGEFNSSDSKEGTSISRAKRNVILPTSLKDSFVLTTLGKRQVVPVDELESTTYQQPRPDSLSSQLCQQNVFCAG